MKYKIIIGYLVFSYVYTYLVILNNYWPYSVLDPVEGLDVEQLRGLVTMSLVFAPVTLPLFSAISVWLWIIDPLVRVMS